MFYLDIHSFINRVIFSRMEICASARMMLLKEWDEGIQKGPCPLFYSTKWATICCVIGFQRLFFSCIVFRVFLFLWWNEYEVLNVDDDIGCICNMHHVYHNVLFFSFLSNNYYHVIRVSLRKSHSFLQIFA